MSQDRFFRSIPDENNYQNNLKDGTDHFLFLSQNSRCALEKNHEPIWGVDTFRTSVMDARGELSHNDLELSTYF